MVFRQLIQQPILYYCSLFQATYKQWCSKGTRIPGGRCYSTLSPRSSHLNSHSNTDSYSRQSSIRYQETEVARLHDSRRPLVISFRRKKRQSGRIPGQAVILDEELQEALDSLKECRKVDRMLPSRAVHSLPVLSQFDKERIDKDCGYVEVHSLESSHICPLDDRPNDDT